MSKKYVYNITVPVTGSVSILVESDEEISSTSEAYEKAYAAIEEIHFTYCFSTPEDDKAHSEVGPMMLGEDWGFHEALNRGNVCRAVCPQTDWQLEEVIDEEEE